MDDTHEFLGHLFLHLDDFIQPLFAVLQRVEGVFVNIVDEHSLWRDFHLRHVNHFWTWGGATASEHLVCHLLHHLASTKGKSTLQNDKWHAMVALEILLEHDLEAFTVFGVFREGVGIAFNLFTNDIAQ